MMACTFFCFVPKYLGLPVHTKYCVKNCLFVSWGRPECYFSFTLDHFYTYTVLDMANIFHLQSHPCNCLGAWPISISLLSFFYFLFAELHLKKFWAWAETKSGLVWGRIQAKVPGKFNFFFGSSARSNSICSFVLATGIMGLNMKMWTC